MLYFSFIIKILKVQYIAVVILIFFFIYKAILNFFPKLKHNFEKRREKSMHDVYFAR